METCLAMTIFREEFNVNFVAMFTILTFIKVFHWLVQDRVDYIETTPTVSRLSHARILIFMGILLVRELASHSNGDLAHRASYVQAMHCCSHVACCHATAHLSRLVFPQSVDSAFLQYLIGKTLAKSASVHLLFAFEYIIQARTRTPVSIVRHNVQGGHFALRIGFIETNADVILIGGIVGMAELWFKCLRCSVIIMARFHV